MLLVIKLKIKRYTGLWWLPENPDTKIFGTLRYKPGEYPILSLFGSYVGHIEYIKNRKEGGFHEIILGIVDNKKSHW
jgi:hypothetical protein